jgi:hypothetical protein
LDISYREFKGVGAKKGGLLFEMAELGREEGEEDAPQGLD